MTQLVTFELTLVAVDQPTTRSRWNGERMHSAEASAALRVAVEAFQQAIRDAGFEIASTGYGAKATAVEGTTPC